MAINNISIPSRRNFEHRFFLAVAVFFPLAALIGFAPTFYLKPFFGTPAIARSIIWVHGLTMTAWMVLFVTQVYLISSKRVRLHQRLGFVGIALAIVIFITGLLTAIAAAKYGSASSPPDIPPLQFLIVPVGDMLVFAALFGAAIYYRKNAANHKRLILLTVLNFLPPAVARFPGSMTADFGPLWFFGVPTILTIVFIVLDTYRNRKLNVAFLFGGIFLIASEWIRLIFASSTIWLAIAFWLTA